MKTPMILISFALFLGTSGARAAETAKPYSKNTCIVSDNTLGSMGRVVTKVHNGHEVKFCCKPCVKKFDRNPEKYLSKLGGK